MTKCKALLLGGVVSGSVGMLWPLFALAQDAGKNQKIEEIVVTAEKRKESLQKVAISISAFKATMLQARGVTSSSDLAAVVPGLDMSQQLFNATPFIRGIGSANSAAGEEPANAVYVDGVYRPSLPGAIFNFNNIERVEVLKGPQGTLFGRNAVGGVIDIITKDPSATPSADLNVGYGNYNTTEISGYGTTGIAKGLATDLSVYWMNQATGYLRNIANNDKVGTEDEFSVRNKWDWKSADAGTEVLLSLDLDNHKSGSGIGMNQVGSAKFVDGSTNQGFYTIDSNVDPLGLTRQKGAAVTVKHDLGWAQLTSISAYRHTRSQLALDQDATALPIVNVFYYIPEDTWTQEVQLGSPAGSAIKWLAGFFYFNDKVGYDPLTLSGFAFAPLPTYNETVSEDAQSYALYGQATAPITSSTNLTVGYRYTIDNRSVNGYSYTSPLIIPPNGEVPGTRGSGAAQFEKGTYRFALNQQFTPSIMGYISANRGFKSGLFNTQTPTLPAIRPETLDAYEIGEKAQFFGNRLRLNAAAFFYQFNNLQVQTVDAGVVYLLNAAAAQVKGLDIEMDAAPLEHLNMQAAVGYLDGTYTSFPNAPANSPAPPPAPGGNVSSTIDATGHAMVHTPRWTPSIGFQYTIPTNFGSYQVAETTSYDSGFYWDPDNRVKQPAYTLVNASLTWRSPNSLWDIRLWGKNLAAQHYYSYATAQALGDTGAPAPPLTFGVSVGVHFE